MHLLCNSSGMILRDVVVAGDIDLHLVQAIARLAWSGQWGERVWFTARQGQGCKLRRIAS
jgi:hypothetical protein